MVAPVSVTSVSSANPNSANRADNVFDSSGWTVRTGGGIGGASSFPVSSWLLIAGAVVLGLVLWKKR